MRLQRYSEQGSIFVVVIAAVTIAAMIAVSYLLLTNDHRERAGRAVDQARTQIRLEEDVLEAKRLIARQAKSGQISLAEVASQIGKKSATEDNANDVVKFGLDGVENGSKRLSPFLDSLTLLVPLGADGDPFFRAKALVLKVNIEASAQTTQSRLPGKDVTFTPWIEVRQIPISQFTLFSLNGPITVNPSVFGGGQGGRMYAAQDLTVSGSGNLSVNYPLVSGGDIRTGTTLSVRTGDQIGTQVDVSNVTAYKNPNDDAKAEWLAQARTQYDSALITSGTLPVDVALVPSSSQPSDSQGLDIAQTGAQCQVELVIDVNESDKKGSYRVTATRGASDWIVPPAAEGQSSTVATHQDVPFVAKQADIGGMSGKIVVAFNYAALTARAPSEVRSIYVHTNGAPADAVVLIRGAAALNNDLSIVTPHIVMIAGDFNNGQSSRAASIITGQNVQAVDSTTGNNDFGTAP